MCERNGADAVKLQTYTADTMTQLNKPRFKLKSGLWKGYKLGIYMTKLTPYLA